MNWVDRKDLCSLEILQSHFSVHIHMKEFYHEIANTPLYVAAEFCEWTLSHDTVRQTFKNEEG